MGAEIVGSTVQVVLQGGGSEGGGDGPCGAPGGLEIEAAGDGVYVKDFAGEIESGHFAGF